MCDEGRSRCWLLVLSCCLWQDASLLAVGEDWGVGTWEVWGCASLVPRALLCTQQGGVSLSGPGRGRALPFFDSIPNEPRDVSAGGLKDKVGGCEMSEPHAFFLLSTWKLGSREPPGACWMQ
jgi:hypothetical protein